MKKSRFTDSQIIEVIKRAESGESVQGLCRELAISQATFYKWRSKYGGLEASELKRLKELEQQLAQFRTIVADLTLENKGMRGLLAKKF